MLVDPKQKLSRIFLSNIVAGIGWVVGITIGFTIVAGILVQMFQKAGGLPLVGESIQKLIQPTLNRQEQGLLDKVQLPR